MMYPGCTTISGDCALIRVRLLKAISSMKSLQSHTTLRLKKIMSQDENTPGVRALSLLGLLHDG